MKRIKFFLPVWVLFITISCSSINTLTPKEAPASQIPVSTQTIPPTISPTNTLVDSTPTVTATVTQIPMSTASTICPPENFVFPAPEDLENYIGLQYINKPGVDYPAVEFASVINLNGHDYALSGYSLDSDQSYIFVLEKFLCYNDSGRAAWEIVDTFKTQPQVVLIPCTNRHDGGGPEINIECLADLNNGNIISAWTVDPITKMIIEIPTDGLLELTAG